MQDASLLFQMWQRNAAITASSKVDCFFNFFCHIFPLSKCLMSPSTSGCGGAMPPMPPPWRLIFFIFSCFPLQECWMPPCTSRLVAQCCQHASLFQMWQRNATNTASLEVDCIFHFFASFSLSQNTRWLPDLCVCVCVLGGPRHDDHDWGFDHHSYSAWHKVCSNFKK